MKINTITIFSMLLLAAILTSFLGCSSTSSPLVCSPARSPRQSNFNFVFAYDDVKNQEYWTKTKYQNILDTYNNTFKENDKSYCVYLTQTDMDAVLQKMKEINFFDYPDQYLDINGGDLYQSHRFTYMLKIEYDGKMKEVVWPDIHVGGSPSANNLRVLVFILQDIIDSKINLDKQSNFDLVFTYQYGALDTFKDTYTQFTQANPDRWDSINLNLSDDDKQLISQKMVEIDFFNYPTVFHNYPPEGTPVVNGADYLYYFKVKNQNTFKELIWNGVYFSGRELKVTNLRSLVELIEGIFQNKDEYKKLPPIQWFRI